MPDVDTLRWNTTQERPANAARKKQRMTQRDISEKRLKQMMKESEGKGRGKRPPNAKVPSSKQIVADVTAMFPFTH